MSPTSSGTFGSNLLDTCHPDGFTPAGDEHLVLAPAAAASRVPRPTWNLVLMGTSCPHSRATLGAVPQLLPAPPSALSISSHCPSLPLLGEILKPSSQ